MENVKEELVARSEVRSLEELEQGGKRRVKVIRADHIAEMIDAARNHARTEAMADGEHQLATVKQENDALRAEIAAANERLAHFEALFPNGAPAAPTQQAPAEPAPEAAQPGSDQITSVVDQLSNAMNDRLDQMSKKLGISTAVDADEVNLDALFDQDDSGNTTESNLDEMQIKKKTGGGIASNLERLKKLKGND